MPRLTHTMVPLLGLSLTLFWSLVGHHQCCLGDDKFENGSVVDRLRRIQSLTQKVVPQVMPACVAVNDGTGFGSGVIVSSDGLVLTAGHVMVGNSDYELILPNGKKVIARALGKNLSIDAGMLQIISPGPFPFVEIEDSLPSKGDWVISLGHSGGYELGRSPPVRTGRLLEVEAHEMVSDAVLIGGDSGGPLFNLSGKLIGIHSSIGDTIAHNQHVTIPAFRSSWKRMKSGESWGTLPSLDKTPKAKRGIIGVRVDLEASNCRIKFVNQNSPAEEAGIEVGDIVLKFNQTEIRDGRHLIQVIKKKNAGDVCTMLLRRGESEFEVSIQLK